MAQTQAIVIPAGREYICNDCRTIENAVPPGTSFCGQCGSTNIQPTQGGQQAPAPTGTVTQPAPQPPIEPSNLRVTRPTNGVGVRLTWNTVNGATGYNVKRSNVRGGPYTTIAPNVTTTWYTDTTGSPGVRYFYVVTSINVVGESALSNEMFWNFPAPQRQPTPPTPPAPTGGNMQNAPTTTTRYWVEGKNGELEPHAIANLINSGSIPGNQRISVAVNPPQWQPADQVPDVSQWLTPAQNPQQNIPPTTPNAPVQTPVLLVTPKNLPYTGGSVTVYWDLAGARQVFYKGVVVTASETRQENVTADTQFELQYVDSTGAHTLTESVTVAAAPATPTPATPAPAGNPFMQKWGPLLVGEWIAILLAIPFIIILIVISLNYFGPIGILTLLVLFIVALIITIVVRW